MSAIAGTANGNQGPKKNAQTLQAAPGAQRPEANDARREGRTRQEVTARVVPSKPRQFACKVSQEEGAGKRTQNAKEAESGERPFKPERRRRLRILQGGAAPTCEEAQVICNTRREATECTADTRMPPKAEPADKCDYGAHCDVLVGSVPNKRRVHRKRLCATQCVCRGHWTSVKKQSAERDCIFVCAQEAPRLPVRCRAPSPPKKKKSHHLGFTQPKRRAHDRESKKNHGSKHTSPTHNVLDH
jgi:hypothetical protein